MPRQKPDWTKFTKRVVIARPLQEVYNAWALPKNLTQWFLEKAVYTDKKGKLRSQDETIRKGWKHEWKWHNWDALEEGHVLEANGRDQINFTFGTGGKVHIQLNSLNIGTEIILVQDEIPTDDKGKMSYYVGCSTGWTFWLTNLKAWLEHGITLNATGLKQEETHDLINS